MCWGFSAITLVARHRKYTRRLFRRPGGRGYQLPNLLQPFSLSSPPLLPSHSESPGLLTAVKQPMHSLSIRGVASFSSTAIAKAHAHVHTRTLQRCRQARIVTSRGLKLIIFREEFEERFRNGIIKPGETSKESIRSPTWCMTLRYWQMFANERLIPRVLLSRFENKFH